MANTGRKKTPSARVIAAKWIIKQLDQWANESTLLPEALSALADSRVNAKKADKVDQHLVKLAGKFIERMAKIVDRFENSPAKKAAPKAKTGKNKKKHDEEEE